jgi:hypothetical protein
MASAEQSLALEQSRQLVCISPCTRDRFLAQLLTVVMAFSISPALSLSLLLSLSLSLSPTLSLSLSLDR